MTLKYRFFAALLGAPLLFAVETKSWVHNDRTEFEKGTLKGLSLRSDGRLSLAPQFRELADPSTAYLWALAVDSKGTLYAGGGSPGSSNSKLTAVDSQGKSRTIAEIPGLQIQAIAIDRQDRVYVATAPDGKVYRIGSGGKPELFYDPKAKYIWAMAFNHAGDLFVATGDVGEVHRIRPDGQGSVFFRTEETHARSLAIDEKDNLIVGTEPGGLVIRVSPSGDGFVLYQTSKREVTAVAIARDGSIYVSAVGSRTGGSGTSSTMSIPVSASGGVSINSSGSPTAPSVSPAKPSPGSGSLTPSSSSSTTPSGGSDVYRIGTDGYPQRVWTNSSDIVYAIAFDRAGHPVIGTGNKGNIHRINSDLVSTLLINADPTQVTALVSGPNGRLFAATGNVGKVYSIGPGLEPSGTYESEPLDVGSFSYWGRASFKADLNSGRAKIETRSGNLDRPQKNWSAWAPLDADGRVASPSARFLQYRLTLDAANAGSAASPEVREIEVAYKSKNVSPRISEIEVTPANYKFNAPGALTLSATSTTITLPPIGSRRAASPVSIDTGSASSMTYAKGQSGVRWAATDPNGDDLLYKVEVRGVGEQGWKLLKEKIKERYLSFDSTAFPDGDYVLRVTATDAPDNPPGEALQSSLESDRFVIDNTPPVIGGLTASRSGKKLTAHWQARDDRSVISKAEYSLNGGEWTLVDPTSKLSDAPQLQYDVSMDAPEGEVTLAVRVTDEYDNASVSKAVVTR